MYSIGQVSAMTNLPISTLRYYDKEGFFPNLEKQSGIRRFSQAELDAIRMIECLKRSGLEIKDIRQFFEWVEEGPSTYPNRKAMFEARKAAVEEEMKQLEKTLDMLKFKCWYYEQAIKDGSEDRLKTMIPDHLPDGIRKAYENAHC
mgnify:FL=1